MNSSAFPRLRVFTLTVLGVGIEKENIRTYLVNGTPWYVESHGS